MKFFLSRVKRTSGTIEKGTEVHNDLDSAMQAACAYMAAYAYGHDKENGVIKTDYVQVSMTDVYNVRHDAGCMVWIKEGVNPADI